MSDSVRVYPVRRPPGPFVDGEHTKFGVLRRIMEVWLVTGVHPPLRECVLNCGHRVRVPRGLRPTIGKLTGCPECK